jgi:hypothetical protein
VWRCLSFFRLSIASAGVGLQAERVALESAWHLVTTRYSQVIDRLCSVGGVGVESVLVIKVELDFVRGIVLILFLFICSLAQYHVLFVLGDWTTIHIAFQKQQVNQEANITSSTNKPTTNTSINQPILRRLPLPVAPVSRLLSSLLSA